MPLTGDGYLAGEYPSGTTTVEGVPVSATVRILYRSGSVQAGDGALVAQVQSAPDGTWRVEGLRTDILYDVVGRKEGFNDVIVAGVTPTSMVDITYAGAVVENETFTGAIGFIELVGGIPPYSVAAETPFPSGLFPVISGRNLIIDGTTDADEVASFDVKATSSNGAEKIIPLQLLVGFKAPANFKAETVVVDDVFSVSLTWEVTNTTQQIKVYRSEIPFDMDDLPEPIATLTGSAVSYTDGSVIEDDVFYYMTASACKGFTLYSAEVRGVVTSVDPHWDKVVSLLHFDGNSGDTSITNERSDIWHAYGNANLQSINPRFGETSLMLDGLGSYIQTYSGLPVSSDFTAEAWVCLSGSKTETTIFSQLHPSGAGVNGRINLDVKNGYINTFFGGTGYPGEVITDLAAPIDSYFHVAFCRSGSDFYAALNGQVRLVFSSSRPLASNPFRVGRASSLSQHTSRDLNGYVDELRITKGVARYTENFTPPHKPFPNK